jgi:hypothetical protein
MCSDSYPIEKVGLAGTSARKKQNHEKLGFLSQAEIQRDQE